MSFSISEKKIVGKDGTMLRCEDRIVLTDHFACVIDGATSKSKLLFDDKTQGKIAGELIEKALAKLPEDATLESFVAAANRTFQEFYEDRDVVDHMRDNPVDRLSASAAVYSDVRKEVWLIGDCQVLIGNTAVTNFKLIDEVLANLRALVLELELQKGKSMEDLYQEDVGRNYIMKFLKEQHKFQNAKEQSSFSYGALDGFALNPAHPVCRKVDAFPVILASDGYPKLFETLAETEAYLQHVLESDPLCFRENKSTKGLREGLVSYDDRAFLKIEKN